MNNSKSFNLLSKQTFLKCKDEMMSKVYVYSREYYGIHLNDDTLYLSFIFIAHEMKWHFLTPSFHNVFTFRSSIIEYSQKYFFFGRNLMNFFIDASLLRLKNGIFIIACTFQQHTHLSLSLEIPYLFSYNEIPSPIAHKKKNM